MSVRGAIELRQASLSSSSDAMIDVWLPTHLKRDVGVRASMLKRLSSTMRFSHGARTGALKTAARRSGSAFRLDVRQRVIVKALVSRHVGRGAARGRALAAHVRYLGREGAGERASRQPSSIGKLMQWTAQNGPGTGPSIVITSVSLSHRSTETGSTTCGTTPVT